MAEVLVCWAGRVAKDGDKKRGPVGTAIGTLAIGAIYFTPGPERKLALPHECHPGTGLYLMLARCP